MSQINNAIVYLFKYFEDSTGFNFPNFMVNETPDTNVNTNIDQKYMQQYQQKNTAQHNGAIYKYLYDPNLDFNFRFHQRIAKIKYADRSEPWISIIFNTGEVKTLTNVISSTYDQIKTIRSGGMFYELPIRRVLTPINMVFVSNDIDYLNAFLQTLAFYFDRITQYSYITILKYSDTDIYKYPLSAMAKDINQRDLKKLDTEKRGSLVTAGYSFDLIYYVLNLPAQEQGKLLEDIDLQIRLIDGSEYLNIVCTP